MTQAVVMLSQGVWLLRDRWNPRPIPLVTFAVAFRRPPSAGAALKYLPIFAVLSPLPNRRSPGGAAVIAEPIAEGIAVHAVVWISKACLRLAQLPPAMRELAILAASHPCGVEVAEHHLMRLVHQLDRLLVVVPVKI